MNIPVIYATLTGNSEEIAKIVKSELEKNSHKSELISGPQLNNSQIESNELIVIVTSTWGAGEINEEFPNVIKILSSLDLSNKKFGLIGLGDMMYGDYYFCKAIDEAAEVIMNSNGSTATDILRIDGEITEEIKQNVREWSQQLSQG